MNIYDTREGARLHMNRQREGHRNRWGPFLAERAWGTVREDYSKDGNAWTYFPHDHARSRAYRWNEDGIAGICDRHQYLCFAAALWNSQDAILKERMFGLTAHDGNHGEDVKEYYFYLDHIPTHSYMKYLYKYPQAAFPYEQLVEENRRRGKEHPEYEVVDAGIFDQSRYFFLHIRAHLSTGNPFDTSFQTFIKHLLCPHIEPRAQETSGTIERGSSGRKACAVSNRPGRGA